MAQNAVVSKNPAEFFAENQSIAGFDNPGKSMFTTIREFVENSLDAAEAIGQLPVVDVKVVELSKKSFEEYRGLETGARVDTDLYTTTNTKARRKSTKGGTSQQQQQSGVDGAAGAPTVVPTTKGAAQKKFYKIICRDNGCGMPHDRVPDMFGRVLTGSKYSVKQARGKFGLGAKMALIWSKKSTGLPISITTAYRRAAESPAPKFKTFCKVDIYMDKNEPNVLEHAKLENPDGWNGSEISVIIEGKWSAYKTKVLDYMQQLAVVTSYADLSIEYVSEDKPKQSFKIVHKHNTPEIPRLPREVKHHPMSVDNIIMERLLAHSKSKSVEQFMVKDLSCIKPALAKRLVAELVNIAPDEPWDTLKPESLSENQICYLTDLLRVTRKYDKIDESCLSPVGGYNLRLGIMKEFKPKHIALSKAKASSVDGHPFVVEAAVSIGGGGTDAKSGISIYRFANRIPLIFDPGSDVVTRTAKTRINWMSYKINEKAEQVGVYVSIVSTKIPFKGTGKETIGDDILPIQESVKVALQDCCRQLRGELTKELTAKSQASRVKSLAKYVPDVSRSLFQIFSAMRTEREKDDEPAPPARSSSSSARTSKRTARRQASPESAKKAKLDRLFQEITAHEVTAKSIAERLRDTIQKADAMQTLEHINSQRRGHAERQVMFLATGKRDDTLSAKVMEHKLCTLRLLEAFAAD